MSIKRYIFLPIITCLSSCSTAQEATTLNHPQSLSELQGQWEIVRFNNFIPERRPFNGVQVGVSFHENGVGYGMGCAATGFSSSIKASGKLVETPSDDDYAVIGVGCPKRLEKRNNQLFEFMKSEPTIFWNGVDKLILESGKSRLVLETKENGRLRHAPRSLSPVLGNWYVESYSEGGRGWGGQGAYMQGQIQIKPDYIAYSNCNNIRIGILYSEKAYLNTTTKIISEEELLAQCPKLNPTEIKLLQLLQSSPALNMENERRIHIGIDKYRAVLTRSKY